MPLSTAGLDGPLKGRPASWAPGWVRELAERPAHMSVGAARLGDPHTRCSAPHAPRLEEVSEVLVISSAIGVTNIAAIA